MVAVATSRVFKSHKWRDALLFQRAHVTPERSERTADVGLNEWGAVVVTPLMKMFQRVDGSTLSRSNWRLLKFLRGALDFCLRRRYVDRGFAISMFTCLLPPCTQREREKERHMTGRSRLSALAEGKKKKNQHIFHQCQPVNNSLVFVQLVRVSQGNISHYPSAAGRHCFSLYDVGELISHKPKCKYNQQLISALYLFRSRVTAMD